MKYTGENDNFDFKLAIFHDLCNRADIPDHAKPKAFPTMLRSLALDYYYANIVNKHLDFDGICNAITNYFEGPEYKRSVLSKWNSTTLRSVINSNTGKSTEECLQILISTLRHLQHGLNHDLRTDHFFHNKLINACQDIPACRYACYRPSDSLSGLINELRSSIITFEKSQLESNQTFLTDRRYHFPNRENRQRKQTRYRKKRCFVCNKEGCWSTKHTKEEQEDSKRRFKERFTRNFNRFTRQYITEYEGNDNSDDDDGEEDEMDEIEINQALESFNIDAELLPESFLTFETMLTTTLADQSFLHTVTGEYNPNNDTNPDFDPFAYTTDVIRYNDKEFYGIMIDTGASNKSTAGFGQFQAYKRIYNTDLDTTRAGAVHIQFGIGSSSSIGSIKIQTPIGPVEFHVVNADTPFLLCLADMDALQAYYNNIENVLVTPSNIFPIIRRFGHPFLLWDQHLHTFITDSLKANPCYLTEVELRRLHRRFGHPSATRLHHILERSGRDADKKTIDHLTKFCDQCQRHGKAPTRFKFNLREDIDFNHSIIVDIMYIDNQPILHVVDEATRFQAARWLKNGSTKATWDALRLCWIDVYIGPPDMIVTDARSNFTSQEFHQHAAVMGISTKTVPVEAAWSIGITERYHFVLRRAYKIIVEETQAEKEVALQMAVKAVNDSAGPNGLIPTLLVFGAFPRMTEMDPPAPSIAVRAMAIKKAMNEIAKIRAEHQVADALRQRNGPSTADIHDLPLLSPVLVWRKDTGQSGHWTGPYTLLSMDGETCKVQLPHGPTDFRSTVVKPYLVESSADNETNPRTDLHDENTATDVEPLHEQPQESLQEQPQEPVRERPQRTHRLPARFQQNIADISVYLTDNLTPFTESRRKEINGLLERGVFMIVNEADIPRDIRIFNSRFVDEIRNSGTNEAYEKSRLVVQAYDDQNKNMILTQSPTIQRVSQRIR